MFANERCYDTMIDISVWSDSATDVDIMLLRMLLSPALQHTADQYLGHLKLSNRT